VDSVSATAGSSTVNVSGSATFVNTPTQVAEDGAGDGLVPGVGFDVTTGTISRNVGSNNLVFSLNADMNATIGGAPGVLYGWAISVDGNDTGLYMTASRAGGTGCTNGCWSLNRDGGNNQSSRVATLTGTLGNGVVSWNVSLATIGASTGSTISNGGAGLTGTITGADGVGFCCTIIDSFFADDYTVPGASVRLGIATAGTPEGSVPLGSPVTVNAGTGAFSGSVPLPAQSGSYIVVAQACYAPDNCGLKSTTITI
jgi:hypothetical protein